VIDDGGIAVESDTRHGARVLCTGRKCRPAPCRQRRKSGASAAIRSLNR